MTSKPSERLIKRVKSEAMEWGDNVASDYHGVAASHMNAQWEGLISPILSRHDIDLSNTIDFACGYGRNGKKLAEMGAEKVLLVDVNPDNIAYCKQHLVRTGPFSTFLNNGLDLSGLKSNSYSHVYSFDAMVHFDLEIVLAYVGEFSRVLKPRGTAFIHHSNYTKNPGGDFRQNPHWRNFMSADIFKHVSIRNGFDILEQTIFSWGEADIDCITMLRRIS